MNLSRRRLLSIVPVGVFFGLLQQVGGTAFLRGFRYDGKELTHIASEAFRKVYHIMVVPNWIENKPENFDKLVITAGFKSYVDNALLKENTWIVIQVDGKIMEFHLPPNTDIAKWTKTYDNIDDAIFGIYGVEKI